MDAVFIHRYFEISLKSYEKLQKKYSYDDTAIGKKGFANEIELPRRQLSLAFPPSYSQALDQHKKLLEIEHKKGIQKWIFSEHSPFSFLTQYIPKERLPLVIYQKGVAPLSEEKSIAVVGTRHPSSLGKEATTLFSSYFAAMNLQIVSGLAIGVDAIAHRAGLRNKTHAWVAGCLFDIYPKENVSLVTEILKNGGSILSPYPSHQIPIARNFPARNEFIAASSMGTMMIEGGVKSGASITAKWALAMGKNVVTLSQDYRTDYGRGATEIQRAGANFVSNEKEAFAHLTSHLG